MNGRMRSQRRGTASPERSASRRTPLRATERSIASAITPTIKSPGQPLDARIRALMEPRFGHDFGQVRVHTDSRAEASAHALNALAYTMGDEIVFGQGRYAPESAAGQRLLAHELTHVVQQHRSSSDSGTPTRLEVSEPQDTAEQEAKTVASQIGTGEPAHVQAAPTAAIARQDDEESLQCVDESIPEAVLQSVAESVPEDSAQCIDESIPLAVDGMPVVGSPQEEGDTNPHGEEHGETSEGLEALGVIPGAMAIPEVIIENKNIFKGITKGLPEIADPVERGVLHGMSTQAGAVLGGLGGVIELGEGIHGIAEAKEGTDYILPGMQTVAGGMEVGGALGALGVGGTSAGSLAAMGPYGAALGAGIGAYKGTTALLEHFVDPYLNRPHMEDVPTDENGKERSF